MTRALDGQMREKVQIVDDVVGQQGSVSQRSRMVLEGVTISP